jgi:hypothetical protein
MTVVARGTPIHLYALWHPTGLAGFLESEV